MRLRPAELVGDKVGMGERERIRDGDKVVGLGGIDKREDSGDEVEEDKVVVDKIGEEVRDIPNRAEVIEKESVSHEDEL